MDNAPNDVSPAIEAKPAEAPRNRRWGRWVLGGVAGFLALLIAAALYLQTAGAFERFILPVAVRNTPGKLSIQSGSVSLGGKLQASSVAYETPDGSFSLKVPSVMIRVSIRSLLFGHVPHMNEAILESPEIVVSQKTEKHDKEEKAKKKPDETQQSPATGAYVPVEIDRLRISGLSLSLLQDGKSELSLTKTDLAVDGLARGSSAKASLQTRYVLAADDKARTRSGTTELNLNLDQNSSGERLKWDGSLNHLDQIGLPGSAEGLASALRFEAKIKGDIQRNEAVHGEGSVIAKQAGKTTGEIGGTVEWAHGDKQQDQINSTLEFKAVTREFLNPILAFAGPAQLQSGMIDGAVVLKTAGEIVSFDANLSGSGLSIKQAPGSEATPKIEFASNQKGAFNQSTQVLTLDQAKIDLKEDTRMIAAVALERPAKLVLKPAQDAKTATPSKEITNLTLSIPRITLKEVTPWMALTGNDALANLQSGEMKGDLKFAITGEGDRIDVAGLLDFADVRVKREKAEPLGPLTIENRLDAKIVKMSEITVAPSATRLLMNGELLASTSLSGDYDLGKQSADIALDHVIADLAKLLDKLGLLTDEQRGKMTGGALKGTIKLARAGEKAGLGIKTDLALNDVTLVGPDKKSLTESVKLICDIATDPSGHELTINAATLDVARSGAAASGNIAVKGYWPLGAPDPKAAKSRGGKADLTIRGLDGGPWLGFFGVLKSDQVSEVPIVADMKLEVDGAGNRFKSSGTTEIGPVKLASGAAAPQEVSISVKSDFEKLGDELKTILVDLRTTEKGTAKGTAKVEGSGKLGERPSFKLVADLKGVDAAFFDELVRGKQERKEIEPEIIEGEQAPPPVEPPAAKSGPAEPIEPLPFDLDLKVNLDSIAYRQFSVDELKASILGNGSGVHALLAPSKLVGGTLQGEFNLDMKNEARKLDWNFQGAGIDTGLISESLAPGKVKQLEGLLSFKTVGSGATQGDALTDKLKGNVLFDLANGRIGRSKLLHYIAQKTKVDAFDQMLFKSFHGDLDILDGWANMKDVRVEGNAVQLIASGRVGLDGRYDFGVYPKIGPQLAQKFNIGKIGGQLLSSVDGLLEFPLSFTVRGTSQKPRYGVAPHVPGTIKKGAGFVGETASSTARMGEKALNGVPSETVKAGGEMVTGTAKTVIKGGTDAVKTGGELVTGTAKGAVKVGTGAAKDVGGAVGGILRGGGKAVKGLFGGKKKEGAAEETPVPPAPEPEKAP